MAGGQQAAASSSRQLAVGGSAVEQPPTTRYYIRDHPPVNRLSENVLKELTTSESASRSGLRWFDISQTGCGLT